MAIYVESPFFTNVVDGRDYEQQNHYELVMDEFLVIFTTFF